MREICWTDESEEHIWVRHKVTPDEVEQVVYKRPRYVTDGRDKTQYIYGQTDAGRYLLVVLSESLTGGCYVVTAREMTDAEQRTYRRKARLQPASEGAQTMDKIEQTRSYLDDHDTSAEMENGHWETDTSEDPMVTTSLRLPKSLLDWIRGEAAAEHVKPTAWIRSLIEHRAAESGLEERVSVLESALAACLAALQQRGQPTRSSILAAMSGRMNKGSATKRIPLAADKVARSVRNKAVRSGKSR